MRSPLTQARTAVAEALDYKTLWFPCDETPTTALHALYLAAPTAYVAGETIRGGTSGATGVVHSSGTDPHDSSPLVIYTPVSGTFTQPEVVTGLTSSLTGTIAIGIDPYPLIQSDDGAVVWGPYTAATDMILGTAGYVAMGVGENRKFLVGSPLAAIGTKDFVFQVVHETPATSYVATQMNLGAIASGDSIRMEENKYLIVADATGSVDTLSTAAQYSSAVIRRAGQFFGMRNTTKHEHNPTNLSAGNLDLTNFTSCMSMDLRATVADGKVFGILLATFAANTMPCLDVLKEGIAFHKTEWLANNKVLYGGW